jgi:hypothetical protein
MAKTFTAAVLFVFLVISADPVAADLYKWVDENGVVHFSDTPPKSKQEIETIATPDYPPPNAGIEVEEPETYSEPAPEKPAIKKTYRRKKQKKIVNNQVEIFTTDW